MKSQLHLSAWWQQIVNWYFLMLQTSAGTHRCREGVENTKSDVHIDILCARTHAVRTHTRGRGDLIKCRQRLCGLAYSEAGSQAATATVHLGQLDVASKPGRPQSNGFTGDIVVCVVSNQQCPLLGSAAAEAAERVTWQQPVQQRPACMLCDLPLMCMWWNRRPRGWK